IGTCTPEADSVLPSLIRSSQVCGGEEMPALENDLALYQTVDLFAASTGTQYILPLYEPSWPHSEAKFELTAETTSEPTGNILFEEAYCAIAPGRDRIAMSGGVPPATLVPSTP